MIGKFIQRKILEKLNDYIQDYQFGESQTHYSLENVKLKSDILTKLKFPIFLELGQIKKLEIKIPWLSLGSQPVEIIIDGLNIIAAVQEKSDWQQSDIFDQKLLEQSLLRVIEEVSQELSQTQVNNNGYLEKLKNKILDNIQIKIRGVHIRFEDQLSSYKSYSFGVVMKSLELVNTNEIWEPHFVDRTQSQSTTMFKLLRIEGFGLYLNPNDQLIIHQLTSDINERIEMMDGILTWESSEQQAKTKKFKFLRPISTGVLKSNASQWWKFAIESVLRINRARKGSLREFTITHTQSQIYKAQFSQLFEMYYQNQKTDQWSNEEKLQLRHILLSYDPEQLRPWIKEIITDIENIKKDKFLSIHNTMKVVSWFFGSGNSPNNPQQEEEEKQFRDELDKLKLSIDNEKSTDKNNTKQTKLFANLQIQEIQIDIAQSTDFNTLQGLGLYFKETILSYQYQGQFVQATGSIKDIGLEMFTMIQDTQVKISTSFVLITKKKFHSLTQDQSLSFTFIQNDPSMKGVDNFIQLQLGSLIFKYNQEFMKQGQSLSNMQVGDYQSNAVIDTYDDFRDTTSAQIQQILYKKVNKFRIEIGSPIIILPLNDQKQNLSPVFILRLGDLAIISQESTQEYEGYDIHLQSIGMQYFISYELWTNRQFENGSNLRNQEEYVEDKDNFDKNQIFNVLEDFTLKIMIKLKQKKGGQLMLSQQQKIEYWKKAKTHIEGSSSSIKLNLSHFIYNKLVNLGQIFNFESDIKQQVQQEKLKMKKEAVFKAQKIGSLKKRLDPIKKWEKFFCILNGSYLYFYQSDQQNVHSNYFNIKEAKIKIKDESIGLPFTLILQNKFGECNLAFDNENQMNQWLNKINANIYDLSVNNAPMIENISLPDTLKKKPKNFDSVLSYFSFHLPQVQLNLLKDQDQTTKHWVKLIIDEFKINSESKIADSEMNLILGDLKLIDITLPAFQTLLSKGNNSQLKAFQMKSLSSTKESSNFKGVNSIIKAQLADLELTFHPNALNEVLKFFNYTRPLDENDEPIQVPQQPIQQSQEQQNQVVVGQVQQESCAIVRDNYMRFEMEILGVQIRMHHQDYFMELCRMESSNLKITYSTFFDHFNFTTDMKDLKFYDLTNWPYTIDPKTYLQDKDSIKQNKNLIMSIQPDISNQNIQSGLTFFYETYYSNFCKLKKHSYHSRMDLVIQPLQVFYFQEAVMRINSYFFEKFLFAVLYTDPYFDAIADFKKLKEGLKIQSILGIQELQQMTETVEMNITIKKLDLILKDRPQNKNYLALSLGEMILTQKLQNKIGRVKDDKYKELICVIMEMKFIDLQFKYVDIKNNEQMLSPKFKMKMDIIRPSWSPLFEKLDPHAVEMGMHLDLNFDPIELKLPQDIYTFILQMLDLNMNHTDFMYKEFYFVNFYDFEDYMALLKGVVFMRMEILFQQFNLILYHVDGSFISELQLQEMTYHMTKYLDYENTQKIKIKNFFIFEEKFQKNDKFYKEAVIGPLNSAQLILQDNGQKKRKIKHVLRSDKMSQLSIVIDTSPNGDKKQLINIQGLRINVKPHILLMVYNFLLYSWPIYDKDQLDKPYYFTEDPEDYPKMILNLIVSRSVLVFQNRPGLKKTIVCEGDIFFDIVGESIKQLKRDFNQQNNIPQKIWEMSVRIQNFRPFITFAQQLQTEKQYDRISKTQLFTPFDFYYTCRYEMLKQDDIFGVNCFTDIKLSKMKMKMTIQDIHLMLQISSYASENIAKEYTEKLKKIDEYIKQKKLELLQAKEDEELQNELKDEQNDIVPELNLFDIRQTLKEHFSIDLDKLPNKSNRAQSIRGKSVQQIIEIIQSDDLEIEVDMIQEHLNSKYEQTIADQFNRLTETTKALQLLAEQYNTLNQKNQKSSFLKNSKIKQQKEKENVAKKANQELFQEEKKESEQDEIKVFVDSDLGINHNGREKKVILDPKKPATENLIQNVQNIWLYGIKILFINDFDLVFCPVLDIEIPILKFDQYQEGAYAHDLLILKRMKVFYYNGYLSDWEPFLENFELKYEVIKDINLHKLQLDFPKIISINVTERCIQNLVDTYNAWMVSPSFDLDEDAKNALATGNHHNKEERKQSEFDEDDKFQQLTLCSIMNLTNLNLKVQRVNNKNAEDSKRHENSSHQNSSDQQQSSIVEISDERITGVIRDYNLNPGQEVEYAIEDVQQRDDEVQSGIDLFQNIEEIKQDEKEFVLGTKPKPQNKEKTMKFKRKLQELVHVQFDNFKNIDNLDLNQVQQRCIQLLPKTVYINGKQQENMEPLNYQFDKKVFLEGYDEKTNKQKKKNKLLTVNDPHAQYLIFGITMNKLRKIFTIRTPYAFYNNTNVEYGIVITHRVNGEVSEEFTLKSKQRWPINFKFYQDHDYKIYVKRPDDKCYYSANQAIDQLLDLKLKEGSILSHYKDQLTYIQKVKNDLKGAYDFVLKPPLIIKNGLPCQLIIIYGTLEDEKYSLEKGSEKHEHNQKIYDFDSEEIVFRFQVEGYEEQEVRLNNQLYLVEDRDFKIQSDGFSSHICIRVQSENAIVSLTFYAYTCITNHSDHKLTFTYANLQKTLLAGQNLSPKFCFHNKDDPIYARIQNNYSKAINIKQIGLADTFSIISTSLNPNQSAQDIERDTKTKRNTHGDFRAQEVNKLLEFFYTTYLSLAIENDFVYTKIVEIMPKYVMINNMKTGIIISQEGVERQARQKLQRNERIEWAWLDANIPLKRLVIKKIDFIQDEQLNEEERLELDQIDEQARKCKWKWSRSFDVENVGILAIQIRKNGISTRIRNAIKIIKGTMFIVFEDEDEKAPYFKIINETDYMALRFVQSGVSYEEESQKLLPQSQIPYAFTDPKLPSILHCHFLFEKTELKNLDMSKELIQQATYELFKQNYSFDIMDKEQPPVKYTSSDGLEVQINVKIYTDGCTKIISFSQQKIALQSKQSKKDLNQEEVEALEKIKNIKAQKIEQKITLKEINFSMICPVLQNREERREIALFTIENLKIHTKQEDGKKEVVFLLGNFQIDNQSNINALYQTIFQPVRYKKTRFMIKQSLPMIEFYMIQNVERPEVTFIENLEVVIQGIVIKCDDEFIGYTVSFAYDLLGMLKTNLTGVHPLFQKQINQQAAAIMGEQVQQAQIVTDWKHYDIKCAQDRVYIRNAKLSSLTIELSFLARKNFQLGKREDSIYLMKIMNSSGLAIINIDEAPMELQAFHQKELFGFYEDFINIITNHYKDGIKTNLIKLVGSTDILGNPTKLVKTIGRGISGIIDGEGVTGKVLGAGIFLKSSAEGVCGWLQAFTGSISKGLLLLSFDENYLQDREERLITKKPKNFVEGVGFGSEQLIKSVYSSVGGLVKRPYKEAKKSGFKGAAYGTLSAITGFVLKPASGTIDMFVKSTEGVKNTLKVFDKQLLVERHRLPRPFYGAQKQIKPFEESDAYIVSRLLNNIKEGIFQNDHFIEAIRYEVLDATVLLIMTTENLILLEAAQKAVWWYIPTQNIEKVLQLENGIVINQKKKKQKEIAIVIEDPDEEYRIYKRLKELLIKSQNP